MNKKLMVISMLGSVLVSGCGVFEALTTPGEYMPIYLQESSPLDPPGMEAIRAEARAKYVKEGLYADGETLDVQQGKAVLFNRNPDYYEGARGNMVKTATARIISCEGLYYFVEIEDGSKGFLRETDFVNPVKLVSTAAEEGEAPASGAWVPAGEQKMMTNSSGRTVVVVNKKSRKSDEFEARRRALDSSSAPAADDGGLPTPTAELPEPAGSLGE